MCAVAITVLLSVTLTRCWEAAAGCPKAIACSSVTFIGSKVKRQLSVLTSFGVRFRAALLLPVSACYWCVFGSRVSVLKGLCSIFVLQQRREMKESLTRALEELKAKGHEGDLPAPDMVAQRIEATMFKHFGASFL